MLGNRIKSLRKEHEWNQSELAKMIGVGRTTITEYEADRILPPYDKIQALAKIFGVTVKYLTGEANSRTDEPADVEDIAEQLNRMIDNLKDVNFSIKMDGQIIDVETKKIIASQLESALRMARYMNKTNK